MPQSYAVSVCLKGTRGEEASWPGKKLQKQNKYFRLWVSYCSFSNVYAAEVPLFFSLFFPPLRVSAPRGAGMLAGSLPMKRRKGLAYISYNVIDVCAKHAGFVQKQHQKQRLPDTKRH